MRSGDSKEKELIKQIKLDISKGLTREGLKKLYDYFEDYRDNIIILLNRFEIFNNEELRGISENKTEINKINSDILNLCKSIISEINTGIDDKMDIEITTDHEYAIMRINSSQREYSATFWGLLTSKKGINHLVKTEAFKAFYAVNLKAIARGVRIKRIFILSKKEYLDDEKKFIDKGAFEFMTRQANDGINVRIGWIEIYKEFEISKKSLSDFAIIDDKGVVINYFGPIGNCIENRYNKSIEAVTLYQTTFEKLWNLGKNLNSLEPKII